MWSDTALMSSAESPSTAEFDQVQRALLLDLADASIREGLRHGRPCPVDVAAYPQSLRRDGAAFVTLHRNGQLRGCIGHLEAVQSLLDDVAENAFNAAFRDPRFKPLESAELDGLEVEISVLGVPRPLEFSSESDLVDQIRPGVDGLILKAGYHQGTFLPTVWESLPDKRDFLQHLKQKAGLAVDYWSDNVRVWRYTTESFARHNHA